MSETRAHTPLGTLLSGAALASSWTWCIGMYAPFILYGMFGWPGIVAFAIPNILGCTLFGFLRSREQSLRETRDHAHAMVLFSAATIAYQVFFAASHMGPFIEEVPREGVDQTRVLAAAGLLAAAALLAWLPRRVLWLVAGLGFFVSLSTFAFLPWGSFNPLHSSGEWTREQLAFVLPTIVFGFMLSPNLDLTFHRGRQDSPDERRPANFIVFGLGFASMLVLTTCYLMTPQGLTLPAVRAHIALQLLLTCALHMNEIRAARVSQWMRHASLVGAGVLGLAAALLSDSRDMYLSFLGLYGLLFPAYAALALRVAGPLSVKNLAVLFGAVALSTPLVWIAFLDGPFLLAPLAVVFPIAAVALCGRSRERSVANPA